MPTEVKTTMHIYAQKYYQNPVPAAWSLWMYELVHLSKSSVFSLQDG